MNKLGRNTLAVGLATLLVTSAMSFSANGADETVAQSASSAATGTGLFELLDTDVCEAVFPTGEPTGRCGAGLDTTGIDAFAQEAEAGVEGENGVSAASASVSPIAIEDFTSLDISDLITDIAAIDTGNVLDPILGGVGGLVGDLLELLGLNVVTDAVDDVLQDVLAGVETALPISLQIGAVESQCVADPTSATGSSTVASTDLLIELGGQDIVVPVTAGTEPNSNLLVGAPQDLVDGIIDGLEDTLTQSLGGALAALNPLLDGLQNQLVGPLLDALEPTLLQGLADALAPIISGTVNKQVETDGAIEVSALELTLIGGNQLNLANVACGPNTTFVVADDNDADAQVDVDVDVDVDADAQADAIADADAAADADATVALPNTGAPNLLPFWLLGLGLVLFGAAVLVNERRRLTV